MPRWQAARAAIVPMPKPRPARAAAGAARPAAAAEQRRQPTLQIADTSSRSGGPWSGLLPPPQGLRLPPELPPGSFHAMFRSRYSWKVKKAEVGRGPASAQDASDGLGTRDCRNGSGWAQVFAPDSVARSAPGPRSGTVLEGLPRHRDLQVDARRRAASALPAPRLPRRTAPARVPPRARARCADARSPARETRRSHRPAGSVPCPGLRRQPDATHIAELAGFDARRLADEIRLVEHLDLRQRARADFAQNTGSPARCARGDSDPRHRSRAAAGSLRALPASVERNAATSSCGRSRTNPTVSASNAKRASGRSSRRTVGSSVANN